MVQTYEDIIRDFKNKIYHPVYLLYGEEPYYIDYIDNYAEEHILDEASKAFNQSVLYGRDVDLPALMSTVKRFPMMSDYQLIILREGQDLKGLFKSDDETEPVGKKKESPNLLIPYLQNPLKSSILIICYKYQKVDKRTKVFKLIEKAGVICESKKLWDKQLPGWIAKYIATRKCTITAKATELIAEYLGNDLSKISNELDKLLLNVKEGEEITPDHIEQNIGISKDYNIFELQDAIGSKDVLKANRIINYFAANPKTNPLVLTLFNFYSYFTKLIMMHVMPDKSKDAVVKTLGIFDSYYEKYMVAKKNYNAAKLQEIVSLLREYDLRSKGVDDTGTDEGELLKELVFRILH